MNTIGSGLIIEQQGAFPSTSMIEGLVQDTSFTNHSIPSNVETSYHFSVISVYNLRYLNIINCTFAMSKQTAVQVFYSTLYFGGHVIFSGNNGTLGMKLNSDSSCPTLMFKLPTIMPREEVVSTLKMKL